VVRRHHRRRAVTPASDQASHHARRDPWLVDERDDHAGGAEVGQRGQTDTKRRPHSGRPVVVDDDDRVFQRRSATHLVSRGAEHDDHRIAAAVAQGRHRSVDEQLPVELDQRLRPAEASSATGSEHEPGRSGHHGWLTP
jgi:hypothetical protein